MKLKQLLAAYEDIYCRIVTPINTHYIESSEDKRLILMMYGDWLVDSFCAYAYDDFDGFIRIKINEPKRK